MFKRRASVEVKAEVPTRLDRYKIGDVLTFKPDTYNSVSFLHRYGKHPLVEDVKDYSPSDIRMGTGHTQKVCFCGQWVSGAHFLPILRTPSPT